MTLRHRWPSARTKTFTAGGGRLLRDGGQGVVDDADQVGVEGGDGAVDVSFADQVDVEADLFDGFEGEGEQFVAQGRSVSPGMCTARMVVRMSLIVLLSWVTASARFSAPRVPARSVPRFQGHAGGEQPLEDPSCMS